jgi:hypothetical protein
MDSRYAKFNQLQKAILMPNLLGVYNIVVICCMFIQYYSLTIAFISTVAVSVAVIVWLLANGMIRKVSRLLVWGIAVSVGDILSTLWALLDPVVSANAVETNPLFSASAARHPVGALSVFLLFKITVMLILLSSYYPLGMPNTMEQRLKEALRAVDGRIEERMGGLELIIPRCCFALVFRKANVLTVEDMEELDSSIVLLMARRKIEYIAICTIILLASLSNIAIIIFNHLTYFRCAYWTWPVFLGCAGLVILILYVFDERIIRRQYKHFQS